MILIILCIKIKHLYFHRNSTPFLKNVCLISNALLIQKYEFNKLCNLLDSIRTDLDDSDFDAKSRVELESAKI